MGTQIATDYFETPLRERFRFDWQRVVQELQEAGLSQETIARRIGTQQPYVAQLKAAVRGQKVSYELGAALLELREEVLGGSLPKREPQPHRRG